MAITDNWGYVKQMLAGSLGLLMAQSTTSAESKFLSLIKSFNYMENNMNKISLSIKTILTVATAMSRRVAISFVLVLLTMATQANANQLTTQITALVYNYDYKNLCSEEGECLYCRLITECQAERSWPDKCVTKDSESEFFILATGGCETRTELDCYQCDCDDEPPFNCSSAK